MPLLVWSDLFSVGVKDIDDQHRQLIALANRLDDAIKDGRGHDALAGILAELFSYTQYHFAFEEKLMAQQSYAKAEQHKLEHKGLAKTVDEFGDKLASGDAALTAEVMGFLRDWLTRHIMNSDKMLGQDLGQKGIK